MVVDLAVAAGFAATVKFTSPLPVPDRFGSVTHAAPGVAVQPQVDDVVTVKRPAPPSGVKSADGGASVNVHAAAVWVSVNTWSPTVIVAVRGVVAGLA